MVSGSINVQAKIQNFATKVNCNESQLTKSLHFAGACHKLEGCARHNSTLQLESAWTLCAPSELDI
jgi:hypothetical protein